MKPIEAAKTGFCVYDKPASRYNHKSYWLPWLKTGEKTVAAFHRSATTGFVRSFWVHAEIREDDGLK